MAVSAGDGWVTYTKVDAADRRGLSRQSTRSRSHSRTWPPSSRNGGSLGQGAARAGGHRRRGSVQQAAGGSVRAPREQRHRQQSRRCRSTATRRMATPHQPPSRFASFDSRPRTRAGARSPRTWTAAAARYATVTLRRPTHGGSSRHRTTGRGRRARPSRLTLTFGFGDLFDDRYGLAAKRPAELSTSPVQRDQLDPEVGRRPLRPGLCRRPTGRVPRDPQPHPHRARRHRCVGCGAFSPTTVGTGTPAT
jgi:hypothetical protein